MILSLNKETKSNSFLNNWISFILNYSCVSLYSLHTISFIASTSCSLPIFVGFFYIFNFFFFFFFFFLTWSLTSISSCDSFCWISVIVNLTFSSLVAVYLCFLWCSSSSVQILSDINWLFFNLCLQRLLSFLSFSVNKKKKRLNQVLFVCSLWSFSLIDFVFHSNLFRLSNLDGKGINITKEKTSWPILWIRVPDKM